MIIDLRGARAAHAITHLQRDQASRLDVVSEARPLGVRVLEARHIAHVRWGTGTHASHSGIAHRRTFQIRGWANASTNIRSRRYLLHEAHVWIGALRVLVGGRGVHEL